MTSAIRNCLEGVVFVSLFPVWLLMALVARVVGWMQRRTRVAGSFRCAVRRWAGLMTTGLRLHRETWWPLPRLESVGVFWRHVLLIEFFAALNQAGRRQSQADRFIVLKLAHVGDAMHIEPMLRQLMREKPGASVDLVVGPWCKDLAERWQVSGTTWVYTASLLMFHRGDRRRVLGLPGELRFLFRLRSACATCVLSTGTMTMAELLLIVAANPGQWVGSGDAVTARYPEIPSIEEPYDSREYEADRVSRLLRHLGLEPAYGRPGYPLRDEEVLWAESRWPDSVRRVVMAPGAGWSGKIWSSERFGAVARALSLDGSVQVVVTGSAGEKGLADDMAKICPAIVNLVGATTLGQTVALIASADLLITNDSGPLHMAAASDTPSVSLFGPTIASKWKPRGTRHCVIQKVGYCAGCIAWHPAATCLHNHACMNAISVDEVLEAARRSLCTSTRKGVSC